MRGGPTRHGAHYNLLRNEPILAAVLLDLGDLFYDFSYRIEGVGVGHTHSKDVGVVGPLGLIPGEVFGVDVLHLLLVFDYGA